MKIMSPEWVNALAEKLKSDEEFQQKGKGFDSKFQFAALADPKAGANEAIYVGVNLPQADEVWFEKKPDNEVDIILEGKYGEFVNVLKGKANLLMSVTMGKLRLKKGEASKLTSYMGAVNRFIELAKSISG